MTKPRERKTANGKAYKYYWCCKETGGHCSGRWVQHTPAECIPAAEFKKRLEAKQARHATRTPDSHGSNDKIKEKLKVAKSLPSIVDDNKFNSNDA